MEIEGVEQQIYLQPEMAIVGAVYSVNGYTGHVVLTTSDLENTSGYQTSTDVANLIATHNSDEEAHPYIQNLISAKQDPIVAGNGISLSGNVVSVDTTVVATQQNLSDEVTNRENADIALQGQIDAISASSDVVDIVGTYQELQNYDTQHLKDNDIIKVLQDSTQGNATTYYRWSTSTQTFTLIGQEGPYYTKAGADAQFVPQTRTINSKPLSANITLTASDVSALGQNDIVQTTGTSTSQVMSQNAVTTALATKLDSADVPAGFFDGPATTSPTPGTSLEIKDTIKMKSFELQGDIQQQTYTGKNLFDISKVLTNGANLVNNDDGSITASLATGAVGTSPNTLGTYCPSLQVGDTVSLSFTTTGSINYVYLGAPASQAWVKNANKTITQDMLNAPVYWYGGTGNTAITYSDIQVELGTSATPYEPFVGGAPSPNPDYPQTVNVVTGTQTVTVTGKNLFNRTNAEENKLLAWVTGTTSNEQGSLVSDYIPVTPAEKLKFTYNAQVLFYGPSKNYIGALQTDGTSVLPSGGGGGNFNKITVPSLSNIAYMRLGFRAPYSSSVNLLTANIQVERGEVATTYEPYQGQSYTIELGSTELCKIGNYQDYIYQGSDGWYIHKATGKRDVTSISSIYSSAGIGYIGAQFDVTDMASNSRMNGYCNILIPMNSPSGATTEGITFGAGNKYVYVILKDSRMASSTEANWNAWLASNATTIYYPLATATDTKITDSTLIGQLDTLLSAQIYPEYTAISATGNLSAILGVTAYNSNLNGIIEVLASTVNTIGNIYSALNIINNGGNL